MPLYGVGLYKRLGDVRVSFSGLPICLVVEMLLKGTIVFRLESRNT
jgi:hypothetical protein